MPDIRLPSGKIIKNVPEGVSKEQIKQKLISSGVATEADFLPQQPQAAPQPQLQQDQFPAQATDEQLLQQAQALQATQQQPSVSDGILNAEQITEFLRKQRRERTGFPMTPGTSRASKELPEILEASPQGGLLSGVDVGPAKVAAISSAILTTPDENELADIVTNLVPEIGKQFAPDGSIILANNETGARVVINKPGLSKTDIAQLLGLGAAFTPAGRAATIGTQGAKATAQTVGQRAAQGGLAAAGTQAGIEAGQAALGGEFDEEDIALAGGFGVAAELAVPAVQAGATKIRDFLRPNVADDVEQILRAGEEANVPLLTSDVIPPTTALGKTVRNIGEKLGPLGTAGKREAQQEAREALVRQIADEFGIENVNDDFLPKVVDSLFRKNAKILESHNLTRRQAIESLKDFGEVEINNTRRVFDKLKADQARLKTAAKPEVESLINKYEAALEGRNFEDLAAVRSEIIRELKDIGRSDKTAALAPAQAIKSAIDKDMAIFGRRNDKEALKKWLRSNRGLSAQLSKAKNSELKRVLESGDISPKKVAPILRGGDPTELKRLDSVLTNKGRRAAQATIIKEALDTSGFFQGANPDRFATALSKPKAQRAINIFFKGEDKARLQGFIKLLNSTRQAQQAAAAPRTGEQILTAGIGGGSVAALLTDPIITLMAAPTIIAAAKGYESKALRNALLKLGKAKKGSAEERALLNRYRPEINAAVQAVQQQNQEDQE